MDSRMSVADFETCLALASEGCKAVASQMRKVLLKHTKALAVATGAVK
jgi:ribonuclease PH